jgi:hypothetical protein
MRKIAGSAKTRCSVVELRAEARSRPKGFSTTTRASAAQPAARQLLDHRGEQARRDREVVQRPRRVAERAQRGEGRRVRVVAVDEAQQLDQRANAASDRRRRRAPRRCRGARARRRSKLHPDLRDADDRHVEPPAAHQRCSAGKIFL